MEEDAQYHLILPVVDLISQPERAGFQLPYSVEASTQGLSLFWVLFKFLNYIREPDVFVSLSLKELPFEGFRSLYRIRHALLLTRQN